MKKFFSLFFLLSFICFHANSAKAKQRHYSFEVPKRIIFYNGITDKHIAIIEGNCSIDDFPNREIPRYFVSCKTKSGTKNYSFDVSKNVTIIVEEFDKKDGEKEHFQVNFNPNIPSN